jgi:hypothetical protein
MLTDLGAPEMLAGISTILAGDTITEFTNPNPLGVTIHESVGLGISAFAGIAVIGLAAEIKRRTRAKANT